ncbi:hypothetical protein ACFQZ4_11760 [Catellatospora coxensis]
MLARGGTSRMGRSSAGASASTLGTKSASRATSPKRQRRRTPSSRSSDSARVPGRSASASPDSTQTHEGCSVSGAIMPGYALAVTRR